MCGRGSSGALSLSNYAKYRVQKGKRGGNPHPPLFPPSQSLSVCVAGYAYFWIRRHASIDSGVERGNMRINRRTTDAEGRAGNAKGGQSMISAVQIKT